MTPDLPNLQRDLENILESAERAVSLRAKGDHEDADEAATEAVNLTLETLGEVRASMLGVGDRSRWGTPDDGLGDLTLLHLEGETHPVVADDRDDLAAMQRDRTTGDDNPFDRLEAELEARPMVFGGRRGA